MSSLKNQTKALRLSKHTRHSFGGGSGPVKFLLSCCLLMLVVACETDTTVTVDGQNPPSFRLSGSGGINDFNVHLASAENGHSGSRPPDLWRIEPIDSMRISKVPLITYGIVPPGFRQIIPEKGAPPTLTEGVNYNAGATTYDANGGGIYFSVSNNKSLALETNPQISVTGIGYPEFKVSGSGDLQKLYVSKEPSGSEKGSVRLWQIRPSETVDTGYSAPVIIYGKLPEGYAQDDPKAGSPPLLTEGHEYAVSIETFSPDTGIQTARKLFSIKDGRIGELSK